MNKGKRGRPYEYTDGMIAYLGGLASAEVAVLFSGGASEDLSAFGLDVPDFSTVWRRVIRLESRGCPADGH